MEQLTRIEVTKLFGYLDHDVKLNSANGITVLHGANGSGKTTILRAIDSCSREIPFSLLEIPFETFTFTFSSGSKLTLRNKKKGHGQIELHERRRKGQSFEFDSSRRKSLAADWGFGADFQWTLAQFMSARIDDDDDDDADAPSPAAELQKKLGSDSDSPEWLTQFWERFWCTLIEEQRLLRLESKTKKKGNQFTRVVSEFSERIRSLIREVQRDYGKRSQQLERSYFQRAVAAMSATPPNPTEVANRFVEVELRRKALTSAGLLDAEDQALPLHSDKLLNEEVRGLLSLYANDTWDKLKLFDDVFARITLLESLLNEYFSHKEVHLSRNGIEILTKGKDRLEPESLSSGEQHVLVLFFSLLFESDDKRRLILIDEPELSLHPRWQIRFIDDLEKIRQLAPADFILASHSPLILEGHRDSARNLQL